MEFHETYTELYDNCVMIHLSFHEDVISCGGVIALCLQISMIFSILSNNLVSDGWTLSIQSHNLVTNGCNFVKRVARGKQASCLLHWVSVLTLGVPLFRFTLLQNR